MNYVTAGKKYRFTVEAKADQEIELNAGIIIDKALYLTIPRLEREQNGKHQIRHFS